MYLNLSTRLRARLRDLCAAAILGTTAMLSAPAAVAEIVQNSHVTDIVTPLIDGGWQYQFTVFNDSTGTDPVTGAVGVVVDWELPYFDDMGITNVVSPFGWDFTIETIGVANAATGWDGVAAWNDPTDPWYIALGGDSNPIFDATQVLHWYCVDPVLFTGDGIFGGCFGGEGGLSSILLPGDSLSGFGFDAAYAPVQAPYQTSWLELPVNTGDPAFPGGASTVGSPSATRTAGSVPVPSALLLLAAGLLPLSGALRRRRSSRT